MFGSSNVLAAKILGHTGDIARFASADHYASYTGTAPIEVSSGEQTRHRLSRAGNRSLNHALHIAARVQTMHPGPGRTHYQRKRAEQKTSAEALRSLKRQLAKIVYRHLHNDHTRQAATTHHSLAVFDRHTGEALYLGRSRCLASAAQRIVLYASDTAVCTP